MPLVLRPDTGGNHNSIAIDLAATTLIGAIAQTSSGFAIENGSLGARWPTASALYDFRPLDLGGFLCGTNSAYKTFKSYICSAADIMARPIQDKSGAVCEAISLTLGFRAGAARLGRVYDPPFVTPVCPPNWQPSCLDP